MERLHYITDAIKKKEKKEEETFKRIWSWLFSYFAFCLPGNGEGEKYFICYEIDTE